MVCPTCGRSVAAEHRFCNGCGHSLKGVTDVTEVLTPVAAPPLPPPPPAPVEGWSRGDPQWAPTGSVPAQRAAADQRTELIETELIEAEPIDPERELAETQLIETPTTAAPADLDDVDSDAMWAAAAGDAAPTAKSGPPASVTATIPVQTVPTPAHRSADRAAFRFGAVTIAAPAATLAALLASFTTTVSVTSTTRLVADPNVTGFSLGSWQLDDLAGNASIAMLVASLLMVVGGVAAGVGWRWGSGLAGGAGLALVGMTALMLGLAQFPIDAARDFANTPSPTPFVLTITRDVGYWLLVGTATLGLIVFGASLRGFSGDRRSGLNPWIAALGALATVVAVVGPMLPEGRAIFSDNWYLIEGPGQPSAMLVAGRLLQLMTLALTGVFGYLCVRRWGLGLAIGGALPVVWLAVSTLFEIGTEGVGPAYRNPGADSSDLHGVTIIGISAVVAMAILALVAASDQSARERS